MNQIATSNLRIRAICNDQSAYSCDVSLGSFQGTKVTKKIFHSFHFHSVVSNRSLSRKFPLIFPKYFSVFNYSGNILQTFRCTQQNCTQNFLLIRFVQSFEDSANCEGVMKLYPLDKSSKNLHIRVAMRIFNVDRMQPTIFHQSILTINRNTQTDCCRSDEVVQAGVTMRHAAVQVGFLCIENEINKLN